MVEPPPHKWREVGSIPTWRTIKMKDYIMKMNDNRWIGFTFIFSMAISAIIQFGIESSECVYDKDAKANVCSRVIDDGEPITGSVMNIIDSDKTYYWGK